MSAAVARAVAALWLSRAAAIALNLLLLPLLFRHMEQGELGVWLLMGQAGAIVALLDFGVTSVLTRRIALASGQAGSGLAEINGLLRSALPLYRAAALCVGGGGLLVGWAVSARLGLDGAAAVRAGAAWAILCAAYACAMLTNLHMAALTGLGHVAAGALLSAGVTAAVMAMQCALLPFGGGVVGLAALALGGAVVQRWVVRTRLRRYAPRVDARQGGSSPEILRSLLGASLRYWLMELGAVALLRTDGLFIVGTQQPASIPGYAAAYSVVFNLALAAMAVAEAAQVFVSRMWRDQDPAAVHALVLRSMRAGLALMLCGCAVLAVAGEPLLAAWIGPGHLPGQAVLLIFCAMLTLYVQQSLLLGFSRATEHEAYAPCYLLAGALNLLLTWVLAGWLGLPGIALGTLAAQALTTSWFVPVSALRRLGIGWRSYWNGALLPALAAAVPTGVATWMAVRHVPYGVPLVQALAGAGAGGGVALACGWFLVLDAPMRVTVRRRTAALVHPR